MVPTIYIIIMLIIILFSQTVFKILSILNGNILHVFVLIYVNKLM